MKRNRSALWYFSALTILYLILVFALPASNATRHTYALSSSQYHILLFVVELPLIAVWFTVFYGYAKLAEYASALDGAAEGPDFRSIAGGARWIAWGLPIPAIISLFLSSIANSHPGFHATSLIINNYISLLILLVAFSLISNGSRALAQRAKVQVTLGGAKALILFFVMMGVAFCFFAFRHMDLQSLGNATNPYYLPTWLAALTLMVPYLYTWLIGLLAAYEILLLARHASGILYRHALQMLVGGLVLVIATSTALQYYRSVIPRSGHLSIGLTLVIVYIFEIGTGVGFYLLACGAKKLKKIEEV